MTTLTAGAQWQTIGTCFRMHGNADHRAFFIPSHAMVWHDEAGSITRRLAELAFGPDVMGDTVQVVLVEVNPDTEPVEDRGVCYRTESGVLLTATAEWGTEDSYRIACRIKAERVLTPAELDGGSIVVVELREAPEEEIKDDE